uniref:18aa ORF protein n=1 Tax=Homo sapiens TaxID=9606 RepID=V9H0V3_HUMAN|nr:hypothetical protein 2 estrogen receptor 5'-region - human [Homo sapiens]CAA44320.1 18aa ORF [Homo sapiens]
MEHFWKDVLDPAGWPAGF